jgi:hypothetical protein
VGENGLDRLVEIEIQGVEKHRRLVSRQMLFDHPFQIDLKIADPLDALGIHCVVGTGVANEYVVLEFGNVGHGVTPD